MVQYGLAPEHIGMSIRAVGKEAAV